MPGYFRLWTPNQEHIGWLRLNRIPNRITLTFRQVLIERSEESVESNICLKTSASSEKGTQR